jgi:hypothetical protein
VIIIPSHVPGAKLRVEAYTDAVLKNLQKGANAFQLVAREPLPSDPVRGRLLHATLTRDAIGLEYYYGIITAGDRAFLIMGSAEVPRRRGGDPSHHRLVPPAAPVARGSDQLPGLVRERRRPSTSSSALSALFTYAPCLLTRLPTSLHRDSTPRMRPGL